MAVAAFQTSANEAAEGSPSSREVECKFLEAEPGRRITLIEDIKYDLSKGILLEVHAEQRNRHLISSQRDTPDFALLKMGMKGSLRVRGTAFSPRAIATHTAEKDTEICIKGEGFIDPDSGATIRHEFEADNNSFEDNDLAGLKRKYPRHVPGNEFLYQALGALKGQQIVEYFRLPVDRTRLVVEIPHYCLGLSQEQRFVAELNFDRIKTVTPKGEQLADPYVEVEFEALEKECKWYLDERVAGIVCRNLSEAEKSAGIEFLANHILELLPPGMLVPDHGSKASRGFDAFFDRYPGLAFSRHRNSDTDPVFGTG